MGGDISEKNDEVEELAAVCVSSSEPFATPSAQTFESLLASLFVVFELSCFSSQYQLPRLLSNLGSIITSRILRPFLLTMAGNKRRNPKTPSPKKRASKRARATRATAATPDIHLPGGALQTSFRVEGIMLSFICVFYRH